MERITYYGECTECGAAWWPTETQVRPDWRRVVVQLECMACGHVMELRLLVRTLEEQED